MRFRMRVGRDKGRVKRKGGATGRGRARDAEGETPDPLGGERGRSVGSSGSDPGWGLSGQTAEMAKRTGLESGLSLPVCDF